MGVFALWPVVFYKNVLVFSNTSYFSKAYFYKSYLSISTTKYDVFVLTNMLMYVDYVFLQIYAHTWWKSYAHAPLSDSDYALATVPN